MDISRKIESAMNDPAKIDAVFIEIAKEIVSKNGTRDDYDALLQKSFDALSGRVSTKKLESLQKISRGPFYEEMKRQRGTMGVDTNAAKKTLIETMKATGPKPSNTFEVSRPALKIEEEPKA